jgi:hypothetical protein
VSCSNTGSVVQVQGSNAAGLLHTQIVEEQALRRAAGECLATIMSDVCS